jgi:hypothetical protein
MSQKVAGSIPDEVIGFLNWRHPSIHTVALGFTQSLTEQSAQNLPWGKGWPVHKADNLTAICELIALKMWAPQHPTAPWTSTAC